MNPHNKKDSNNWAHPFGASWEGVMSKKERVSVKSREMRL